MSVILFDQQLLVNMVPVLLFNDKAMTLHLICNYSGNKNGDGIG